MYISGLAPDDLSSEAKVTDWLARCQVWLMQHQKNTHSYRFTCELDKERQCYYPVVTMSLHGVDTTYHFVPDFFHSQEYQYLLEVGAEFSQLLEAGAYILRGEKQLKAQNFNTMLEWLLQEAKKGQQIQRYKGLGEMNADQLWSTTMDPQTRRLLQVKIEDAISADQIFTTLMGDQVEPRREFIEANALYVENLDI